MRRLFPPSWRMRGQVIAIVAALIQPQPAMADDKSAVKAALVYNILRFATFPGNPGQLRICALSSDPIAGDLRRLEGRPVGRSRVSVTLVGSAAGLGSSCDVIYSDSDSPRSLGGISRGQVLIGSGRNFAESGGTVGLISFGGQLRFVVNAAAAGRASVSFSAQLLQLAARVIS